MKKYAYESNRLCDHGVGIVQSPTVLLLEAGPDETEITDVPSLAAYLQLSRMDWAYKTMYTGRACLGMKNGQCNWPRGKVLGGSSVLNYMLYKPDAGDSIGREIDIRNESRKQIVTAKKEVVMSAGSINTPQILMLSGVGPREELDKHGIPVLADLKVGENLQDHVAMGGLTFRINKPVSIVQDRFQAFPMTMQYVMHRKGPMTTLGGVEGLAFVNTYLGKK
ncbi:unnamed protein product [Acanthoscelides obtectus]|uniref:Glucose-methanol-choline oxidoreductase N-terminal domain-containing protein n=1 Tax=Acanthoscelides obtectus TaxID=200917 RepID=A0A9P0Q575_ACAOB|nr:unnamed protein product [Acanthoscelides obtectus]CAK1659681.1 Oxygen-dependent choline dehydrogenase [Acanthoscelides obtectus]